MASYCRSNAATQTLPIVMGLLQDDCSIALAGPGSVEVDAGGLPMRVSAHCQLVLPCGEAGITFAKGGTVLLRARPIGRREPHRGRVGAAQPIDVDRTVAHRCN